VYAQPPLVVSLSNISIIGVGGDPYVTVRVIAAGSDVAGATTDGTPVCGAFVFTGNNIAVSGFSFNIDAACYTHTLPVGQIIEDGAAISFSGANATFLSLRFIRAVTGVLVTSSNSASTRNSVGNILMSSIEVVDSWPFNSVGGRLASCLGCTVVASIGNVSVNFKSTNMSCSMAYIPTNSLSISTNGNKIDSTALMIGLQVDQDSQDQSNVIDSTFSSFTEFLIIVAVGLLFILLMFLLRSLASSRDIRLPGFNDRLQSQSQSQAEKEKGE